MASQSSVERTGRLAFWLLVSLFFLWGVANNLNDVLVAQFRKTFVLSDLQSGLVQSAFYLGYFILALPASLFMQRFGYKAALVAGLLLFGCGALLFYPAAEMRTYGYFLAALFVIASGLSFLETSANPLVAVLGSPQTAERRLNFAQAFNPLGAISGVLIGRQFILSGIEYTPAQLAHMPRERIAAFYLNEAHTVQLPYLLLGAVVLLWAALLALVRFPRLAGAVPDAPTTGFLRGVAQLLANGRYRFGVIAQFFYVGAQVGVWSFMIRYGQRQVGLSEKTAAAYLTWSLVAFMIGRFAGTALMDRIGPRRLMAGFAAANMLLAAFAAVAGGADGLLAIAATSFFMSIMFPTIFALSISGLGPLTKLAASFLVMAIVGGAAMTALMGWISDMSDIRFAMLVPAGCFAVVFSFAVTGTSQAPATSPAAESR